jgi:hypothetical protein
MRVSAANTILLLALVAWGCGERLVESSGTGRIVLEVTYVREGAAKAAETAATHAVDRMEATVLRFDASRDPMSSPIIVRQDLRRSGGRWKGEIEVEAGSYLVGLEAFKSGSLQWSGAAPVNVSAGGTASAHILLHYVGMIPSVR